MSMYTNNSGSNYNTPVLEGFLDKIGGSVKTWKTRYFRLYANQLNYYETDSSIISKGSILLPGSSLLCYDSAVFPSYPYCFGLIPVNENRQYVFNCANHSERMKWLTALKPLCQVSIKAAQGSLREGYLTKQGGTIKTWKKRWCVLSTTKLTYYKDVTQLTEAIDSIDLTAGLEVENDKNSGNKDEWMFTLKPVSANGRIYKFAAVTESDRDQWVKELRRLKATYEKKQ